MRVRLGREADRRRPSVLCNTATGDSWIVGGIDERTNESEEEDVGLGTMLAEL